MTAEIINLAEYKKKKARRERFAVLEQRLAAGYVVLQTSPNWNKKLEELPNFPPEWIAVDLSCGYKPLSDQEIVDLEKLPQQLHLKLVAIEENPQK